MLVHRQVTLLLLCWTSCALGSVTVYNPNGAVSSGISGTATSVASASSDTYVPAAFNTVTLQAPAIPTPAPATEFTLSLQQSSDQVQGLSIAQAGTFYGFSIEMSVVKQVGTSRLPPAYTITHYCCTVGLNS